MKIRILLIIFSLAHSLPSAEATNAQLELVENSIPVARKLARYFDEKVIDTAIKAYCMNTGAAMGHALMTKAMQFAFGYYNMPYRAAEHLEDDLGWYAGLVVGHHVGEFAIHIRHKVTDVVVPRTYNVVRAFVVAARSHVEEKADSYSTLLGNKLTIWENWLKSCTKTRQA